MRRNFDLYGSAANRLLGGQVARIPSYTAKPYDIETQASARYKFATKMVEALTAKAQENREKEDMAAHMAALSTKFDPSAITPLAEDAPYLSVQREDMAQALAGTPQSPLGGSADNVFEPQAMPVDGMQPSSLGVSADDVLLPATGVEPFRFIDPSEGEDGAAVDAGQRALFGSDPASNPAMQAALLGAVDGDVGTRAEDEAAYMAEQYRNRITPREAVRNLTPQTKAGRDAQYAYELSQIERDQALVDEQREQKFQKELKAIGPPHAPVAPKVSYQKVRKNGKLYWKNVADPNSPLLSEADATRMFDPDAPKKAKDQGLTDERYIEATTGLDDADTMLANIEQMRGLAQSTQTGPLTSFLTDLKSLANTFGMSFEPGEIANVEAMRAVGMKFILDIISKTKGAISEREMAAFEAASPGAGITKLGNKQILDLAEAAAARLTAAHQAVRDAYRVDGAKRINLDDAFLKSKEEWGGFGFIFPPKDLAPDLRDGWGGLTWQEKKAWYDEEGLKY
jgi:hypothetical protein